MATGTTPASAAAVSDDVDNSADARTAASKRNRRLATIAAVVAGLLLVSFAETVANTARTHRADRELFQRWSMVAAEYDCCFPPSPACADGAAALRQLRQRLQARERESHVVADLLARMLGLADIEVTTGPGLAQVEAEFAQCHRLQPTP